MSIFAATVIHTANILGIFTDPFEFAGDYGTHVNPTRDQVFELVVSREALVKNQVEKSQDDVAQAIQQDKDHGPTLGDLVTPELLSEIKKKQDVLQADGFTEADFTDLLAFIGSYKDQKIFRFLRNHPKAFLSLDKALRDQAARQGKPFSLPILSSTQPLYGHTSFELKRNLVDAVFTSETFQLAKYEGKIAQAIAGINKKSLQDLLGDQANPHDLDVFSSRAGQVFFYWMYQALNLHLISIPPDLIQQVNQVKEVFVRTLGDPVARAQALQQQLLAADTAVLFTQESDAIVPQTLIDAGLFLPIDGQNAQDGTLVLLRRDRWESDYTVIPIENDESAKAGRINIVLATEKGTGQKFLLASGHGSSSNAEDGRGQIRLIMEKYDQLSNEKGNLQLFIGIDANTKTDKDVELFRAQLEQLGLVSPHVGPTTVKTRMVTSQHAKAGKLAVDEEDYLITLKPEQGGMYQFSHPTVGFKDGKADVNKPLPNIQNPSDHYPVGATMIPVDAKAGL